MSIIHLDITASAAFNLGAKVAKIIAVIRVPAGKKACICRGFHSSKLFGSEKSNTIFYYGAGFATGKPSQNNKKYPPDK